MQTTHTHARTHIPIASSYGLIGLAFQFQLGQEIFFLRKPPNWSMVPPRLLFN